MMTAQAAMRSTPLACPACDGPVDVRSRHVLVAGAAVRVYCSAACLEARVPAPPEPAAPEPRRRRWLWWLAGGLVVGASVFVIQAQRHVEDAPPPAPLVTSPFEVPQMGQAASEGPDDRRRAEDDAIIGEMMRDTWIHPLAGPTRRMPVNHNGAFGAERAGERPPECASGHCGVDLGQVWGEPVYAVHDGWIDYVQRGPNDDHGGIYVRIAHRGGTLFTWYFHLAAVPRGIQPGLAVTAGTMIGLLGDTGVKHSSPHLHFAMSVRQSKNVERYLDPEPLIAIWPLWNPSEDHAGGHLSTADPGMPVRATGRRKARAKHDTTPEVNAEPPADVTSPDPAP